MMIILIILIGVSGCMSANSKLSSKEKETKVLEYLKNKYNEEFVPLSISESGWGQGHDVIVLYPKNGKKEDVFQAWGTKMDDGTYSVSDGYFKYIIKSEYETAMSSFVKGIYKEFKLYTDFGEGVFPDKLNKNTKISDIYNSSPNISSETIVFVKKSSADGIDVSESLKKIALKMRENKLVGSVKIYVVLDNKYEITNHETLGSVVFKEYFTEDSRKYIDVYSNLEISEVKNG